MKTRIKKLEDKKDNSKLIKNEIKTKEVKNMPFNICKINNY